MAIIDTLIRYNKYSGGSSARSSFSETVLYDYKTDSNGTIYYDDTVITLRDNIENYDLLCLSIISLGDDLDTLWGGTYQYFIDVNSLINSYTPYYFGITSFETRSSFIKIKNNTLQTARRNIAKSNGILRLNGLKFSNKQASSLVSELDINSFNVDDTSIHMIGYLNLDFVVRGTIQKVDNAIKLYNKNNIRANFSWSDYISNSLEMTLTFSNFEANMNRRYNRMLNNGDNYFEYFYDNQRGCLCFGFNNTHSITSILSEEIEIDSNKTILFKNITNDILSNGNHSIGLCWENNNIYITVDGQRYASIPKLDFVPNANYICIGDYDDFSEAYSPTFNINSFVIKDNIN